MTQVTVNGHVYSDDGTAARDMLNGGAKTWHFPMIVDTMVEVATAVAASASASADANRAEDAADAAAAVLSGTSATSVLMGTGSKTFVTQAGKQFAPGTYLRIQRAADPAVYMYCRSTAYDATDGNPLTVNVERIQGAGTFTDWQIFVTSREGDVGPAGALAIGRRAISSNDSVTSTDSMKILSLTGTFTLTLDAPNVLPTNFAFFTSNDGTGEITIPASDGRTNWKIYPGEQRLWQNDGTTIRTIVLNPFSTVLTPSGNFIKPPGYKRFGCRLTAGGGSGAKKALGGSIQRLGGAGAAAFEFQLLAANLANSTAYTIGAGGPPVTVDGTPGVAGGNSSFAGITVYGGAGGNLTNFAAQGGAALLANPSNTVLSPSTTSGVAYFGGASAGINSGLPYAGSSYGGGAGGSLSGTADTAVAPSTSVFAGTGGVANAATSGADGAGPGAGGGATATGPQSGAGIAGQLEIWGEA